MKLVTLEKQPSIRQVAVRCLCSLLDAVPHFNFRESILASVVKNISSSDDTIRSNFDSTVFLSVLVASQQTYFDSTDFR